jgi:hypothetical protein
MSEIASKNTSTMPVKEPRFIAHYLPQFHPIPENDMWWGKGFTEWTNVSRARPLFKGHYQPHLPADLGFYDLRLPEVREAQAAMAREYGIHGFMYYHYWFAGKRLLERPFDEILRSGKPDFPFCLCWANETWSRRWLGEDKEILIQQTYSAEDFRDHARWLAKAFSDHRYIRVNGRPVFVIYRYSGIPSEIPAVQILREELKQQGSDDPYLIAVDAHNPNLDYEGIGFDHRLAFEPQLGVLRLGLDDRPSIKRSWRNLRRGSLSPTLKLYDYTESVNAMERNAADRPRIPSLLVSWDNSPRRGEKGIIFQNCSPQAFGKVLEGRLHRWAKSSPSTDLFFLNGWNEWAEGNHLEPDQKFGLGYLQELRRARDTVGGELGWPGI